VKIAEVTVEAIFITTVTAIFEGGLLARKLWLAIELAGSGRNLWIEKIRSKEG
jgi:hypothetical protein